MCILIDVPTQTKGTISGLFATSAFSGSFWSIQHAHTGDMIMMYNTCTIIIYCIHSSNSCIIDSFIFIFITFITLCFVLGINTFPILLVTSPVLVCCQSRVYCSVIATLLASLFIQTWTTSSTTYFTAVSSQWSNKAATVGSAVFLCVCSSRLSSTLQLLSMDIIMPFQVYI